MPVSLDQIERVYSHEQSLSQCKTWLRAHLPGVELIAVASNGEAARRVRHGARGSRHCRPLGSRCVWACRCCLTGIEDRPDNTTRFLVIGRQTFAPSGHDKTTLVAGRA